MRRNLALGLAWLAAAIAAAVVAWTGVGLVGDQVTDERPATLSSAEVESELAEAAATTTTTAATTTAPPGGGTTTTTAPPAAQQTFRTSRGTAVLNFGPDGVDVEYATPDPGNQYEQSPGDNGGVRVEFEGDDGRSRVEGWWDGGPQWRVDDDGADGGGHGGSGRG